MNQAEYIPGTCNIGKEEVTIRKVAFYITAIITISWFVFCLLSAFHWINMFVLFIVATALAVSYLQYRNRFCIKYGWLYQYNFGKRGFTQSIFNEQQRQADRRKVIEIMAKSMAFAVATLILVYLIKIFF